MAGGILRTKNRLACWKKQAKAHELECNNCRQDCRRVAVLQCFRGSPPADGPRNLLIKRPKPSLQSDSRTIVVLAVLIRR